jgi:transcriptional regulator GlxA family with amidase domain
MSIDAAKETTQLDMLACVERARAYLHANSAKPVPLWELAEAARLSVFHLSRAFREICGASPAAYHRKLRMEKTAEQLGAGISPAKVAKELGFASQASFSRAFMSIYGTTPGRHCLP